MELDLAAYLTSKGIATYKAHGNEITAHCFLDCHDDSKGKGKLYLNVESWLYDCKKCGAAGNRTTLLEHFGDEDELKHAKGADPGIHRRILREAAELAHELLLTNDAMLMYLLERGLTEETIQRKKYGYVPRNFGLCDSLPSRESFSRMDLINSGLMTVSGRDFFNHSIVIPYWSHGSVVQLREKQVDGKYRTPGGNNVRLYNPDSLRGADDVFITEGEFDCDIVEQTLLASNLPKLMSTAVVGLAGAGSWPDGFIEMLEGAKRIFIGFDPDDTGRQYASKLADEIGTRARKMACLPNVHPKVDWSDWLSPRTPKNPHGGHTIRDLQQGLTEADLAGKRMLSVTDAAVKWDQWQKQGTGLKLGFLGLDSVIKPGLLPGQVMIPLAKTGVGKSVWLSNVAHNVIPTARVLYLSQELMATQVYEHFRRIHKFWFPEASPDERDLYYANLRIVDQNRLGKGDVRTLCREYADDVGARPDVVLIDYLQYYARGFRGTNQHERVNEAVMEAKAVAKEEECVVIVPSQVSRGAEHGKPLTLDDARDSGVIEETGDFVPGLYRPEQLVDRNNPNATPPVPSGVFNMALLKSRHGGQGRVFNLKMSTMSLAIVDTLDRKASARVDQENGLSRTGVHYDEYRKQIDDSVGQRELAL